MKLPFARLVCTRTRLIQITAVAFMAGLILARHGLEVNSTIVAASLAGTLTVVRFKKFALLLISLAALCVGIWRGQLVFSSFQPLFENYGEEVILTGQVQDDTSIGDRYQTEFHIQNLHLLNQDGGQVKTAGGRVQIRGFSDNAKIYRGDSVKVSGKLRPSLGNNQGQISFAEISVIGRKQSWLERFRRSFFAGMYSALPDPQASLGLGFLVGLRSLLPTSLLDQLTRIGLTHIVAVSGYNLTILVRFTRRVLAKQSKYLATMASLGLIGGFLAVTGLSASIFRAAIVSVLALGAWYYGRPVKPMVLILLAAAVTTGINPSYIWYDIGWYLSFLSFFGVMVVGPLITRRLYRQHKPNAVAQLFIETFSAQLMVMPLLAFIFGEVSLISLPANLLILPLIPLAMLLSLVAGLAGMLLPSIAGWFAWLANLVLTLIVRLVGWLAGLPWAATQLHLQSWQMLSLYFSILCICLIMWHRSRHLGKITRPSVVD